MLFCSTSILGIPSISSGSGTVGVGTGFDYSSGDYGTATTTDIAYIPLNCKYQNDSFALKLTIPYVSITSEGGNVVGAGSSVVVIPPGDIPPGESKTESGLGDIYFSGTYNLYEGSVQQPLFPMIDLTGKIKFPTADEEKGLGTGEVDYSVESDLTWFTGQTALFGTIGYRFVGSPEAYELNNVLYGSAGLAYQIATRLSGGFMYDVREASTDSGTATSEATLYGSYRMNDNLKFMLYGVKGFSDGSPDYGVGFTLSYSMDTSDVDWLAPVRRLTNF